MLLSTKKINMLTSVWWMLGYEQEEEDSVASQQRINKDSVLKDIKRKNVQKETLFETAKGKRPRRSARLFARRPKIVV